MWETLKEFLAWLFLNKFRSPKNIVDVDYLWEDCGDKLPGIQFPEPWPRPKR